jgi:hypothetical protein
VLWASVPRSASQVRQGDRPLASADDQAASGDSASEAGAADDQQWTYYRFLIPIQPRAPVGKKTSR